MKEHDFKFDSLIAGWYIPDEICDDLIKLYKENKSEWVEGQSVRGVNHEIKKSTEFVIYPNEINKKLEVYIEHLTGCLMEYLKKYPDANDVGSFDLVKNPIKIQHYGKGEGFYRWHCENGGESVTKYRHLVFMTYLNTLEDAGTEFYYQKTTTPCKKGLTVIFPSAWTHTHRGVVNEIGEKYIITGWYSFDMFQ